MEMDLALEPKRRLTEFSCLMDAIPAQFREAVVTAAVDHQKEHELAPEPFIVSVREQLRECVHASLGFERSNDWWEESTLDAVRQCLSPFSACTGSAQGQLAICDLISRISECVLSSSKARRS